MSGNIITNYSIDELKLQLDRSIRENPINNNNSSGVENIDRENNDTINNILIKSKNMIEQLKNDNNNLINYYNNYNKKIIEHYELHISNLNSKVIENEKLKNQEILILNNNILELKKLLSNATEKVETSASTLLTLQNARQLQYDNLKLSIEQRLKEKDNIIFNLEEALKNTELKSHDFLEQIKTSQHEKSVIESSIKQREQESQAIDRINSLKQSYSSSSVSMADTYGSSYNHSSFIYFLTTLPVEMGALYENVKEHQKLRMSIAQYKTNVDNMNAFAHNYQLQALAWKMKAESLEQTNALSNSTLSQTLKHEQSIASNELLLRTISMGHILRQLCLTFQEIDLGHENSMSNSSANSSFKYKQDFLTSLSSPIKLRHSYSNTILGSPSGKLHFEPENNIENIINDNEITAADNFLREQLKLKQLKKAFNLTAMQLNEKSEMLEKVWTSMLDKRDAEISSMQNLLQSVIATLHFDEKPVKAKIGDLKSQIEELSAILNMREESASHFSQSKFPARSPDSLRGYSNNNTTYQLVSPLNFNRAGSTFKK